MNRLTIGRAATEAGVGVETIRFYERKGLLQQPPKPRGGGFRTYTETEVDRVRFIRGAQELGFSLREIDELLSLEADANTDCNEVHAQASRKLEEVEQKIAHLRAVRSALKAIITTCPKQGLAAGRCTILQTLSPKRDSVKRRH